MASPANLTGRQDTAGLTGVIKTSFSSVSAASLLNPPKPHADPLENVEYTDDLATDSAAELTALETAYRDRAKAETDRFRNATDSEYWFAVCFKTREEKEQFLRQFGLFDHGDKYLDGAIVADVLKANMS